MLGKAIRWIISIPISIVLSMLIWVVCSYISYFLLKILFSVRPDVGIIGNIITFIFGDCISHLIGAFLGGCFGGKICPPNNKEIVAVLFAIIYTAHSYISLKANWDHYDSSVIYSMVVVTLISIFLFAYGGYSTNEE